MTITSEDWESSLTTFSLASEVFRIEDRSFESLTMKGPCILLMLAFNLLKSKYFLIETKDDDSKKISNHMANIDETHEESSKGSLKVNKNKPTRFLK